MKNYRAKKPLSVVYDDAEQDSLPPAEIKNDSEVWREFKSGSEIALVYIYKHFYGTVYQYASQFTRDRELIGDCIHDMFMELMQKRKKLSDISSIKFYLFKSIRNTIYRKYRKLNREHTEDDFSTGYEFEFCLSAEQVMIERAITEEKKRKVEKALKKLTRKQREIVYYYYLEGMTIREISELMGFTNDKSAQNLLYKSIKSIKDIVLVFNTIVCFKIFLSVDF
ncbi:DNA-directed RNA polymerase sigma-70 factor [Fulvitalea axinellae]|uniref:DNA-directed RNA polymerase sigma-70 factor n=1 Tax=Fulvitalea axinellae TaxID=1182444 RepID=A0AAU9DBA4_9BACT|nr:DNA-directed RNA polymerase sigma-70 factor [Fulvitalea axinellae]